MKLAYLLAGLCVAISCAVFVGWLFEIETLMRVHKNWVTLRPYGAMTFLLEGCALLLLIPGANSRNRNSYRLGLILAATTAMLGLISSLEYIFHISLGLDQVFFKAALDAAGTPGKIAPNAAISHFLMGLSLFFIDAKTKKGVIVSQLLLAVVFALNMLSLTGYVYEIEQLYGGLAIYTKIAFHAALMFLLLPMGVLFCRADKGIMPLVSGDGAGSVIIRLLLPLVITVPLLFGWFTIKGHQARLYDMTMAVMLLTVSTTLFFSMTVSWAAHVLNRIDFGRQKAEAESYRQNVLVGTLEQERSLRDTFTNALTHDLRNPLSAARMSAQIAGRLSQNHEKLQLQITRIINNIDRADNMINDLLDASLIKAGERLPVKVRECDLNSVVENTLADLYLSHGDRFQLIATTPCLGYWDPDALRRLVENLVTNAVKYGAPDTQITVSLHCQTDVMKISVHNFGGELQPQELERIFQMFHRSPSAEASGKQGWGIGLSLVRGIAEAHNGRVFIESSEGKGTTFTIEIARDCRTV